MLLVCSETRVSGAEVQQLSFSFTIYYGEEGVAPEDFFSILHDFNTVFMVPLPHLFTHPIYIILCIYICTESPT